MSFIFLGRLDELKGIKNLFEAWKKMGTGAPLLVVCGTGPLEEWCIEFIHKWNINNIKMVGKVENIEAKRLISESGALILPSIWYEGFPMTIVESYSVGTPVLGSENGNIGSLIIEGITGLKFSKTSDIIDLVTGMKNEVIRFDRKIIKRFFSNNYSPDSNYNKLMDIYNAVIYNDRDHSL